MKKGTLIAIVLIGTALLLAIINPSFQRTVKIKNHAPEIVNKDSLWQSYCKNGDTASAKIRIGKWVIISNSILGPFSDTVLATYWQMVTANQYTVNCEKYGTITVGLSQTA
jgi:hypothetical protein